MAYSLWYARKRCKMQYDIVKITDLPNLKQQAAEWFSEKWHIPTEAYLESMDEAIQGEKAVPQWYLAFENGCIIGGMGVIENDFHPRKDLAPNVCAVYTEEDCRGRGIAGKLLDFVCADMKENEINTLYLLTDHTSFYERYVWEFHCIVEDNGTASRVYIHKVR